jgi:hypothetical protein
MLDVYIAKNLTDLQKILAPLSDAMKLEVSTDVGIPAATVGELRNLMTLPRAIRLQVPRPVHPDSTVKIELAD